jgi:DHA1 family inner membrane transport protein
MTANSIEKTSPARSIQFQVILLAGLRTIMNTANRMVYPFLAVFARGLGIDLASISLVMSVRSFTAMLTPFFAPTVERFGRKLGMLLALALFTLSNLALFLMPTYPVFFLSQCLSYLSMYFIFSTVHAYVGDQVPYAVRGRSSAILEFSWSLSFILGVPLVGLLISRSGWHAPFPLFSALGFLSFLLVLRFIPRPNPSHNQRINLLAGLKHILKSRAAVAGLIFSVVFHIANETINLVFGVWMEDSFGLKIAALGGAALVIGLADLGGETLSAALVDRLGKKRSVAIGVSLNVVSVLTLILSGGVLWSSLVSLFFLFLSFEFVIVCFLPVMTQVLPQARSTLMSYEVAAHAAGRGFGALLAAPLFVLGFNANIIASAILGLLALLLLRLVTIPDE